MDAERWSADQISGDGSGAPSGSPGNAPANADDSAPSSGEPSAPPIHARSSERYVRRGAIVTAQPVDGGWVVTHPAIADWQAETAEAMTDAAFAQTYEPLFDEKL